MTEDEDVDANDSADERPVKRAKINKRFTPIKPYTIVDADDETDDHYRKIQEIIATLNVSSDLGIYIIRPWPVADSRQIWLKYCGN